jgi:osmoprotectant transport system permease protein
MEEIWTYVSTRQDLILEAFQQHMKMITIALAFAIVIGGVIGYLITYNAKVASIVLYVCGVMMTIPSVALFVVFIPFFGIGTKPAIVAMVLYSLLPIVRNVYVGMTNIDPAIISSAIGMGMTKFKVTYKIKIPLALPVIFAGVRTSTVMCIGLAAIASYIGGRGLGDLIFEGINNNQTYKIIVGGVLVSILTIIFDRVMGAIQKMAERHIS